MAKGKIRSKKPSTKGAIHTRKISYDTMHPVWLFDMVDKDGKFSFQVRRNDFNAPLFIEKLLEYSVMTWAEIKMQTHDRSNKSKNHFLSYSGLSPEARDRLDKKNMNRYNDALFSFAFANKIRVVEIKDNEKFHVLWYDSMHEIYPTKR